jgi:hypothetical protein
MLNVISVLIGLVALVLVAIAFLPFFGIANWIIIPIAVVGAAIGGMSNSSVGRNLNLFVLLVGVFRLWLGGGII